MREATPEKIAEQKRKLKNLEEEWACMNRPYVSFDLKCSMITKMSELKGDINQMEKALAKKNRPRRRRKKTQTTS